MPWLILLLSAVLEAVWATALGASEGFSKPVPTAVFLVTVVLSTWGLGYAVKTIPIGTAYAVWTGIGAALTVLWAVFTGAETLTVAKVICLLGIIGAVAGLNLLPAQQPDLQ